MIPLRIYAKGFMCFREPIEMHFDGAPLWMLTGNNGAGKSAIFDAIFYALYGMHRKGTHNSRFLINKESTGLDVEFEFAVGNDRFCVKRTLNRKGKSTVQATESKGGHSNSTQQAKPLVVAESKQGFEEWRKRIIGLNDEAFTASVLLQQGKGDALLAADNKQRHEILSQIVDLSKYQTLQERADTYRKDHESQAKSCQSQLPLPVDDATIETLASQIESATATYETTRTQLDELISLKVHAQNWGKLVSEQSQLEREIEEAEALFKQGEQIERDAARAAELSRTLPTLRKLFQDGEKLVKLEAQIVSHNRQGANCTKIHKQATSELKEAQVRHSQLNAEQTRLRNASETAQETLSLLAPQISDIEQINKLRSGVAKLDEQLAAYPRDLEEQVSALEKSFSTLNELRGALPYLQQYVDARLRWRAGQEEAEAASRTLQQLTEANTTATAEYEVTQHSLADSQDRLSKAERRNIETQTLYKQAELRLLSFTKLVGQAKCNLCGQDLEPHHFEDEKQRLDNELLKADTERLSAEEAFRLSAKQRNELQLAAQQANGRVSELQRQMEQIKSALTVARQNQAQAEQHGQTALNSLPDEYAHQIHWGTAGVPIQIFSFEFPTEADLESYQSQTAQYKSHERQLVRLRQQQSEHRSLILRRNAEAADIVALEGNYSAEKEVSITGAHRSAGQELSQLKQDLKKIEQQYVAVQRTLDQARMRVESAAAEQHNAAREAQVATALKQELTENIRAQEAELDQAWRIIAHSLTAEQLEELTAEAQALSDAGEQLRQLQIAHDLQNERKSRHAKIVADITDVDVRAQCSLEELNTQECEIQERHQAAGKLKRQAEAEKQSLEDRKRQRLVLEDQRLAHAQRAELYKHLAVLLGRDNLQHHLLHQAETSIVHNANNVLDGISGGTLRLELNQVDEGSADPKSSGKGGTKALDLIAYHSATRADALPVDFLSGGQRFRVAVSLALGIGQYASHGARRIESVIIDEGFGSLDKQGCGDMIAELQRLKDLLGRIILVSHQEEVADAFPNNKYMVELVDGTSRVSLMEEKY